MREHDVLVLPSLFEGVGLVILEAMAQGIPVITTPHTAGPDVITDGADGFIVPIRAPAEIAARLEKLRSDAARAEAMGGAARATAERWTWARYRAGLIEVVGR
jgi:glycosyltransferase involved in cell wall biosynthesis